MTATSTPLTTLTVIGSLLKVDYDFTPERGLLSGEGPDVTFTFELESQGTITKTFNTEECALGDELLHFLECWIPDIEEFYGFLDENFSFALDRLVGRKAELLILGKDERAYITAVYPVAAEIAKIDCSL